MNTFLLTILLSVSLFWGSRRNFAVVLSSFETILKRVAAPIFSHRILETFVKHFIALVPLSDAPLNLVKSWWAVGAQPDRPVRSICFTAGLGLRHFSS